MFTMVMPDRARGMDHLLASFATVTNPNTDKIDYNSCTTFVRERERRECVTCVKKEFTVPYIL